MRSLKCRKPSNLTGSSITALSFAGGPMAMKNVEFLGSWTPSDRVMGTRTFRLKPTTERINLSGCGVQDIKILDGQTYVDWVDSSVETLSQNCQVYAF